MPFEPTRGLPVAWTDDGQFVLVGRNGGCLVVDARSKVQRVELPAAGVFMGIAGRFAFASGPHFYRFAQGASSKTRARTPTGRERDRFLEAARTHEDGLRARRQPKADGIWRGVALDPHRKRQMGRSVEPREDPHLRGVHRPRWNRLCGR